MQRAQPITLMLLTLALISGLFSGPLFAQPAHGAGDSPADAPEGQGVGLLTAGQVRVGRSGIAPPKASDARFVVDSGPYLDRYLGRSQVPGGRLPFQIDITRYYSPWIDSGAVQADGRLKPDVARKLIKHDLLPEQATLELRVYDVDHEVTWGCPEVDELYVNGQQVSDPSTGAPASLTSGNGVWSVWSISVPIELLRFPTAAGSGQPPTPAANTVEVDVDSKCFTQWLVEVDWASLSIEAPVRPIVFAHGWTGDTNTFNTFARYASRDGIPTAAQPALARGIEPIASTSPALASAVAQATREFGVDKVDIFAHSKGGLVARHMLRTQANADRVSRLITFSSPHHGTDWPSSWPVRDNRCNAYASEDDRQRCREAAQELSVDRIREGFNFVRGSCKRGLWGWGEWGGCQPLFTEQGAGVRYATITGDWGDIDERSATLPWRADAAPYPSRPTVDARFGFTHTETIEKEGPYQCAASFISEKLYQRSTCTGAMGNLVSGATAEEPPAATFFEEQVAAAAAGRSELRAVLDGGTDAVFSVVSSAPVTFLLSDPAGRTLTPAAGSAAGISYRAAYAPFYGPNAWMYEYRVTAPAAGTWRYELYGAGPVTAVARGEVRSPLALGYRFDSATYRPGDQIRIEAALGTRSGALAGGQVGGTAALPSGDVRLAFADDGSGGDAAAGDGVFTALLTAPDASAHIPLRIEARRGNTTRIVSASVEVAAQSARLGAVTGAARVDADNNTLYNTLNITATVEVLRAGHFEVVGTLHDGAGAPIAAAAFQSRAAGPPLAPGTHAITLSFDGATIAAHGQDGPYTLANLVLLDQTGASFTVDTKSAAFTTEAYAWQSFERPLIALAAGRAQALDRSGNSLYDELVIELETNVVFPGRYQWNGRLVDQQGLEIGWYSDTGTLGAGELLRFRFDGQRIGRSGGDGPYVLTDISVIQETGGSAAALFSRAFSTAPYSYLEFEGGVPGASLTTSASEKWEYDGAVEFEVRLNAALSEPAQVTYTTEDGSAVAGHDYAATSGTLTFAPGERVKTIAVPIVNDGVEEPLEEFQIRLADPVGPLRLRFPALATVTIIDNDALPSVSLSASALSEVESGKTVPVTATLSLQPDREVRVTLRTRAGSAEAGSDYRSLETVLVFAPGQTSRGATVMLVDDEQIEPPESFKVELSEPVGAVLGEPATTDVIVIDDDVPQVSPQRFRALLPLVRR